MTTHEHEHENDPRTRMSQLLVATLLDEASPAERAEVEAALERDPELCAERDRLQATIGLVRSLDDASAPELLSPAAASKLAAAAEGRSAAGPASPFARNQGAVRSWASSPTFRMAASFALLIGALAAWQATRSRDLAPDRARGSLSQLALPADSRPLEVAQADTRAPGKATTASQEELSLDALQGLGYDGGGGGSGEERGDWLRALGSDGALTDGPAVVAKIEAEGDSAGEPVAPDTLYAVRQESVPGLETIDLDGFGQPEAAPGLAAADPAGESIVLRDSLSAGITVAGDEPNAPGAPAPDRLGADEFYLGRGVQDVKVAADDTALGAVLALEGAPSSSPAAGPASPGPPGSTGGSFAGRKARRASGASGTLRTPEVSEREVELQAGYRFYEDGSGEVVDEEQAEAARLALYARAQADQGEETLERLRQLGYVSEDADDAQVAAGLTALGYADLEELAFENELKNEIEVLRDRIEKGKKDSSRFSSEADEVRLLERKLGELRSGRERRGYRGKQFGWTPAQRAVSIDQLLASCRRRPNERPRDMFYRWWGDNAFEVTRTDALSTFAVDVDTASYTLARRYLVDGILPEKAQIRTEEFVNYFKGDVPPPVETTFAVATELAPSLFNAKPDTWMLRVALRGKEVAKTERMPLALTFVVDVSGSMKEERRLELVKHAMRLLIGELDARDSIAIVAFTNDARMILPMTSARHRALIESAIHPLAPEGGTNVEAGLKMGYEAALVGLSAEANNRVVLLSDGVGNIGETDADRLNQAVAHARERGIYLNTVGVGMDNHNDAFLEQLADKGDGLCNYVDDENEARRALVENFTGAFEPIASDVKIQVEFDPGQVARYRLLGYENRAVADKDFRNDAVDAGEINAGHQVVALYEIERTGNTDPAGPLATVRVRWQKPLRAMASNQMVAGPAQEIAHPVLASTAAGSYEATGAGYRRSVLVAQLAEFLRRSIHARPDSFATLLEQSRLLQGELGDPDFDEFIEMVERTIGLLSNEWGRYDGLARRLDSLRMQRYLQAQIEDLAREHDRVRLEEIDRQCEELEGEIRSMLQGR